MLNKFFEVTKENCNYEQKGYCGKDYKMLSCSAKNCPAIKRIQEIIKKRIDELEAEKNHELTIPLDIKKLQAVIDELNKIIGGK